MITQESVSGWPMFAGVEVSDVLAISAVARRSPDQTLRAAGQLATGDLLRDVRVGTILDERELFLFRDLCRESFRAVSVGLASLPMGSGVSTRQRSCREENA